MQVIILSAGRSGTNLVLECMSGHSLLTPTLYSEDKHLFLRGIIYPNNFLTKCDIVYIPSCEYFHNFMQKNKNAHILWTIRHPYDWVLSKLYRGRVGNNGRIKPSDDATVEGCKLDMFCMYEYLKAAELNYPFRILRVKMEDIILDVEKECKRICKFLCTLYEEEMTRPWERMRHPGKRERYGQKLDTSQINIYKQLPELYDGYFKDKMKDVEELFEYVKPLVTKFGYNIGM